MGLTVRSDSTDGPVAPAVRRGIVSRLELFERLGEAGRVVHLSAPAGSGKTILLRSWFGETGLEESAAWVAVGPDERDPQQFVEAEDHRQVLAQAAEDHAGDVRAHVEVRPA